MAWFPHILESLSLVGVYQFLAEATTTDVVLLFLCSKPLFLLGCVGAALGGRIDADRLPPADTDDAPSLPLEAETRPPSRHD